MTPLQAVVDADTLRLVADAVQERWAAGEPPDALAALATHPELRADKPLVLELAYEEFCLRAERGHAPDPVAFAARFPFAEEVARLLAVHSVIGRHASLGSRRPAVELEPGDMVGDLRVLRPLGRGGFSDVYLVSNAALGHRPEVLKVSTRGDHEAATLGPLRHPHLMPVTAAPQVGGQRAVQSPYLGLATGETLTERAGGSPPAAGLLLKVAGERRLDDPPVADPPAFPVTQNMSHPRAVLHVAAALAGALNYLHANAVSHRDLKPSNVLLGPTGHPYLLDFNLADGGRGGRVGGTVAYAAPEVLTAIRTGTDEVTTDWFAADVYSFAVLVCELLLARHPYLVGAALDTIDGGTVARAADSARHAMTAARLSLPSAARRLLLRALDRDPTARPSAGELARGLAAAVTPRRRWRWRVLAAATVTGALVFAGWSAWGTDREPTEPLARGVWLVNHGQSDVAILAFHKASEDDPTGRAAEWLAYCHARANQPQLAIQWADEAEHAGRTTAAVYANRAVAHLRTNKPFDALEDCRRALRRDPDCRAAKITRGLALVRLHPAAVPLGRPMLAELEAVMSSGPPHVTLSLTVANARLRVENRTAEDVTAAIEAVRLAVRAGKPPDAIRTDRVMNKDLARDPRFDEALAMVPDPQALEQHPELVRPER